MKKTFYFMLYGEQQTGFTLLIIFVYIVCVNWYGILC